MKFSVLLLKSSGYECYPIHIKDLLNIKIEVKLRRWQNALMAAGGVLLIMKAIEFLKAERNGEPISKKIANLQIF